MILVTLLMILVTLLILLVTLLMILVTLLNAAGDATQDSGDAAHDSGDAARDSGEAARDSGGSLITFSMGCERAKHGRITHGCQMKPTFVDRLCFALHGTSAELCVALLLDACLGRSPGRRWSARQKVLTLDGKYTFR